VIPAELRHEQREEGRAGNAEQSARHDRDGGAERGGHEPGLEIVDHHTYAFLGDGCMMEGVSHEACALAGTLGLGKLIAVYDDNGISIDSDKGSIRQWYTDDVKRRFEAYGWQVIGPLDGHDVAQVDRALKKAKREKTRPSLILAKTVIAKREASCPAAACSSRPTRISSGRRGCRACVLKPSP